MLRKLRGSLGHSQVELGHSQGELAKPPSYPCVIGIEQNRLRRDASAKADFHSLAGDPHASHNDDK
jgi:hypothetical protein